MLMLDAQALADHLGIAVADERCERAWAAATRWVENRRSLTRPDILWDEPDVILGALQYGALLYLTKNAPQGIPENEEFASASYGSAMAGIYRLVGSDPVTA